MRKAWSGLLVVLAAGGAAAADLRVLVTDQRGRPVANAVVGALPPTGSSPPAPASKTRTVNQAALEFVPFLEVFRPGDRVVFRNSDRTRHHVYSFSAAKAFEFVLSPGQSSSALTLDRAGVVAVGCNIHDGMINYLYVTDAPWTARTGADGRATLSLPDGVYTVQAWQPRLRPGRAQAVQERVRVASGTPAQLSFKLALLPDSRRARD